MLKIRCSTGSLLNAHHQCIASFLIFCHLHDDLGIVCYIILSDVIKVDFADDLNKLLEPFLNLLSFSDACSLSVGM